MSNTVYSLDKYGTLTPTDKQKASLILRTGTPEERFNLMVDLGIIENAEPSQDIIPKTNVLFVSKFIDIKNLELPLNTTVVRIPPSNRSIYNLTRYSLYRLMCPTFHDLNMNTVFNKTYVTITVKLYSDTVTETPFGGVVGLPVLLSNSA